jgi:hypothetical protein
MKKILALFLVFIAFSACTKLEDLNKNIKDPTTVSGESLFTGAQKNLMDEMTTPNVNRNIFRLISQQWTETTYIDESNYDLTTRTIMDNQWNILYRDVLQDFTRSKSVINDNPIPAGETAAAKQNKMAICEVMIVYTYSVLVETFGNVPYSEALNASIVLPKYDDGLTVYKDLITRLDAAIKQMDAGTTSFGGADNMYGGDVALWKKFSNSLMLHMALVLADVDAGFAQPFAEAAAPNVMQSNADDGKIVYLPSQPNTNPVYENLVASGRNDFVPANTLVDVMNTLNDPRRPLYFTQVGGEYVGGIYGASNDFTAYSHVADQILVPEFPGVLMDYSQTEFLLAIAASRGWNVGGTVDDHYNKGIGASIVAWGGTVDDAIAYISQPSVFWASAAGDWKQKIGTQMWIALYNRGFEAWTQWRIMDYPQLVAPPDAESNVPVRYPFPISEQTLNGANYDAASAAIGGDDVETKLFWDKN